MQVTSDGTLGPESARIDTMTSYEFSQKLRPQSSNGKLYFMAPKGSTASTAYELQVDKVASVTDAEDMTTAIPRFIPADLDRVASCPVNYLMVYGKSGTDTLYCHLFRYSESARVQNAWTKWKLPEGFTLAGMFFNNTRLYCLVSNGDQAHLVMADLAPDLLDEDSTVMTTHLDFRAKEDQVDMVYDSVTDRTLVTLPFDRGDTEGFLQVAVRAPGGVGGPALTEAGAEEVPEGFLAQVIWSESIVEDPDQVVLNGDWTNCALWFGYKYSARHKLSRIYAMGGDGRPIRSGRLSIRKLSCDMANTGYFRAEVTATGRPTRSYTFEGYRYDDPTSIYNVPPDATFVFKVPVGTENEQASIMFINDSHFPSKLLGFEWTGELNTKSTRIS